MLTYEGESNLRTHKGMPLVYISESYYNLNCPVLAKRYLMLTLCEDAIRDGGKLLSGGGVYFRLVWKHGMSHIEVDRYGKEALRLSDENPSFARFPEWIVQQMDHRWMVEYPTAREAGQYAISGPYLQRLLGELDSSDGKSLEALGHYVLSSVPGFRATVRALSHSTDYDIVCSVEGHDLDFRADLGRYFICECKDWSKPANFSSFAKFCRVLDSAKCRFGILFSRNGISGEGKATNAAREQLKVFQDRGIVIIVLSLPDFQSLATGANFISTLRDKYEKVRLDLRQRPDENL